MPPVSPAALAARRQRIIDAAGRCVEAGGAAALTARAVAAEAGISVGALYHHFAGIDALGAALAEQRLVAGITAVAARAPAAEDPLRWAARALVCAPSPGVPARPGASTPEGVVRVVDATVAEVVRASEAVGGVRPDVDGDALAELLALVWEAVDRRLADGGLRTSPDRLAAALADVLDRGVRPAANG